MKYAIMRIREGETRIHVTTRQEFISSYVNNHCDAVYIVRVFPGNVTDAEIKSAMEKIIVAGVA